MGTNEDYLDSLLKSAMEFDQKIDEEAGIEKEADIEKEIDIEKETEIEAEKEIIPDDNPNRQLSPNEIAALFSMSETDETTTDESVEEPEPEAAEEPEAMEEPEPESVEEPELETAEEPKMQDISLLSEFDWDSEPESEPQATEEIAEESETETAVSEQMTSEEEMEIDLNDVDDIDALLGLRELPTEEPTEKEAAEEAGPDFSNQDLTEILDEIGEDDAELAEINELLKKSDQHELVEDDEMLAMLEGISEPEADTKEPDNGEEKTAQQEDAEQMEDLPEKPKKKKWGRKKKKASTEDEEIEEVSEEAEGEMTAESEDIPEELKELKEKKEKKPGFFAKLFQTLTEETEEEEIIENQPEDAEDGTEEIKEKKSKKKKKEKKKKGKNDPKTNEEILEEMDAEDAGKEQKKKKPKKVKEKKEKIPQKEEKGKKLPKKLVSSIFILCFSLMAVIIILTFLLPGILQLKSARKQFYKGNYETAYKELMGQNLSESDQLLLEKAELIVRLSRKASAYEAYQQAGMEEEALNALLEGVADYCENTETYDAFGIRQDADEAYRGLLALLQSVYSIDEEQAKEIIALDQIAYTYRVREIVAGDSTETQDTTEIQPVEAQPTEDNEPEEPEEELEDLLEEEMD